MKRFMFYNCYFRERAENFTPATKLIPPDGPSQDTRIFTAPFTRANREEDYRTAWSFLEVQSDQAVTTATTH